MAKVLVTGDAGFVGAALCQTLLARGDEVVGIDNLNDYYDVALKQARLARLNQTGFTHVTVDLADPAKLDQLFKEHQFDVVVNLAAQAGVRYSLTNPGAYADSNLRGFLNLLEAVRHHCPQAHLVYASSSSVYGANKVIPFAVEHPVDHPVSLYAATKKANELMAHTYSHLYGIPTTGLRFFTVYGPWGRPDMAYFSFTRKILAGESIDIYNFGDCQRDFTYIDDIITGVVHVMDNPPQAQVKPDTAASLNTVSVDSMPAAPYRLYNIGNNQPVKLMDFVVTLEKHLGREAHKNLLPLQPGDVPTTYADISGLERDFDYRPSTTIDTGLKQFVDWYKDYYQV